MVLRVARADDDVGSERHEATRKLEAHARAAAGDEYDLIAEEVGCEDARLRRSFECH